MNFCHKVGAISVIFMRILLFSLSLTDKVNIAPQFLCREARDRRAKRPSRHSARSPAGPYLRDTRYFQPKTLRM